MPLYQYQCQSCGHEEELYHSIKEAGPLFCPKCSRKTWRRVPCYVHTDMKEFRKPIELYSIGLNSEEEIRAFKQKCPEVDVSTDPNDPLWGVPVARTRQQKLKALDAMGFEEAT